MKNSLIVGLNIGNDASTGNMMVNSLEYAVSHGDFDAIICVRYIVRNLLNIKTYSVVGNIGSIKLFYYKILRKFFSRYFYDGNYYKEYTKNVIKIIKKEAKMYKNIIVHLHNVHTCELDVNYLYRWLGRRKYKVCYTIHDCWTFTGGCYYYSHIHCDNWKHNCRKCPLHIRSADSILRRRIRLLLKVKNLTFVHVSNWGLEQMKYTLLKSKPQVVNLGETSLNPVVFDENLKQKLATKAKVVLFIASFWVEWKGVNYIDLIAEKLPDDYSILVIGRAKKFVSKKIIHLEHVEENELANYYNCADVYVSVTQAEQLGLTTCEAQLCGIPVVGFGNCGSKETIIHGKTGFIVENNDIDKLIDKIIYVVEKKPFNKNDIVNNGKRFKKFEHAKRQYLLYKAFAEAD